MSKLNDAEGREALTAATRGHYSQAAEQYLGDCTIFAQCRFRADVAVFASSQYSGDLLQDIASMFRFNA